MEVKKIGNEEFKTLLEGKYFRISNISVFVGIIDNKYFGIKTLPISEGLNIEQKLVDSKGESHCIVRLSVEWDKINNNCKVNELSNNVIDILKSLKNTITDPISLSECIDEFISCCDFAVQALKDIHEVK